jgi:hypothetical protein
MRLTRPLRGTRSHGLFTEIGIIVIGVLIALTAGQAAEAWNWQRKVAEGEQQLLQEARINLQYAAEQVAVQPCLEAQLRTLRDRVLADGATLEPAPVHRDQWGSFVFRLPSRPFGDTTWRALSDDGTSGHMPDQRRQVLSSVYDAIDKLHELRAVTDLMVGRMMMLSHPLPLDAGTRAMLVGALEEQRARSDMQSLVAGQLLGAYRDFGVAFPANPDELLKDSGTVAFCREQGLPLQDWVAVMKAQPSFVE